MKAALFLSLSIAVAGSRLPQYEWDPDSAKDCVDGLTMVKEIQQFTAWNPSLGLDCTPWRLYQSYCIVTQQRLDDSAKTRTTTTPTSTSTSTSTSSTLGPSPTAWEALGCYQAILETLMSSEAGDPALTIPKCQDTCYRTGLPFAGVENGNQCWCSSFIAGERTKNFTDCNLPCSGEDKSICGGVKDYANMFRAAEKPEEQETSCTTSLSKSSSAQSQPTSPISSQSTSGATRNLMLF
ncbi:WSC domain protein [Tolypocladium paradoxum]|uniref:WSC domain protein n=1 Tax=Tolypocladium paradoxum TaxID=94208 RepID=A0A2S4L7U2_9HYPO|nr:WSC domain protein [Tolypocladium paradoxum]